MNYIDVILLILLILPAFSGFRNGFVEELAGLAALVLGIWTALHFSGLAGTYITENYNLHSRYIHIFTFIGIFVLVIILVNLFGRFLSKMVNATPLGFLNRLAGIFFGLLKGALILSVFLVIFNKIDQDVHILPTDAKNNSRMFEPVKNFAPSVFPFLDFWKEENRKRQGDKLI
jgi:membrane protein required for colicin V production